MPNRQYPSESVDYDNTALALPWNGSNRADPFAFICVHPFLICVKFLGRSKRRKLARDKNYNANKKGMNANVRKFVLTTFRVEEIPQ